MQLRSCTAPGVQYKQVDLCNAGVQYNSGFQYRRICATQVFCAIQDDQCNTGFQSNAGGSVQRRRGCRGSGENCFVNAALIAATTY